MMKKLVLMYVVFALVAIAVAWADPPIEVKGFQVPESVYYDVKGDYYLVSNINGKPTDVDDNGYISKVATDGTVVDLKWIDGRAKSVILSAPKGMAVVGDTLYVTDITAVRMFDRATGRPAGAVEIPGAQFANDLAAAPDGSIYVSDMNTNKVHRIAPDGSLTTFASGPDLVQPNGLAVTPEGTVVVAAMGAPEVFSLASDGSKGKVWMTPEAGLDGLVRLADGSFLVSSWKAQAIYRIDPDGTVTPVLTGITSPADIGFDAKRGRLLVPVFMEDRILIVPYRPEKAPVTH
jgi:sugar lactone lactonase YvrE